MARSLSYTRRDIYRHKFIDEFKGSEVQGEAGVWLLVFGSYSQDAK
jgi:hypothetical protein